MATTTSTIPRRRHTELQRLATSRIPTSVHTGRASPTLRTPLTTSLPSPTVMAARAYLQEQSPPIGQDFNALQQRRSLFEAQSFPRRHSALPTPGGLATKMESVKVSSPDKPLEVVREKGNSEPEVKKGKAEVVSVTRVKPHDLVMETAVATGKRAEPTPTPVSEFLRQIPFQYTHDRLRDWGFAYLGNTATADAFINPVSLRRPSLQPVKEAAAGDRPEIPGMVTIRARIVPQSRERKPFVIQRKFDVEEVRASLPAKQRPVSAPLRRSSRSRRSTAQTSIINLQKRSADGYGENASRLGTGAVPIHIEYALHYLPVLAALMLSGHVRKGDTIDLPVPHPEAWCDMIFYVYTGKGETTAGVQANILYLAGNV